MPLLTFYHYASLSEAERFRQIGELIARAVIRYRRRTRVASVDNSQASELGSAAAGVDTTDEAERKILLHITRIGAATPHDLCIALGLSRATVTRKLARLRSAEYLVASGKTTAVRYELKTQPA